MGSDKKSKDEAKGLIRDKLVSYLKFKSAEKAAAEKKKREEAAAAKEEKKTAMVKNIQTFMQLPIEGKKESPVGEKSTEDKSGSLNEYPSYDSQAPQTAMLPLPPAILRVDQGGDSLGGGGGSGGEDPFETLYVGGLV